MQDIHAATAKSHTLKTTLARHPGLGALIVCGIGNIRGAGVYAIEAHKRLGIGIIIAVIFLHYLMLDRKPDRSSPGVEPEAF